MGATKKDRRINAVLSVLLTILCLSLIHISEPTRP